MHLPHPKARAFRSCFLSIFTLLLHRYTSQDEVIVGMPTLGRPQEAFDTAVGHFVNVMPIRAHTLRTQRLVDVLWEHYGLPWSMA